MTKLKLEIMENLTDLIKKILEDELKHLRIYNIDHLGYRYFLPDGRSFGCPTSNEWYEKPRNQNFYASMKNYLSEELIYLHKNRYSYVTRSEDHQENIYLNWLKQFKLDNSIGVYKFQAHRIDSVFFLYSSDLGETRDLLMNKINILEGHVNAITKKVDAIFEVLKEKQDVELRIDSLRYKQIFNYYKKTTRSAQENLTIVFNGQSVFLNSAELNVLKILGAGKSNKLIASTLALSEKTIEKYIGKLKDKFNAPDKNNLINIANTPQLQVALN